MNCKSYQSLTTREKQALIGELVHIVQSDEKAFGFAQDIIRYGKHVGLMDDVELLTEAVPVFHDISRQEYDLLRILFQAKPTTLLGELVHSVCRSGDTERFRELLETLREKCTEDLRAVGGVIGSAAIELLMQGDKTELEVETMGNAIEEEEQTKAALAWISSVFPVWRRNELSVDMFGKEWQSLTEDETVALYMANKPIEETIILSETEVSEG